MEKDFENNYFCLGARNYDAQTGRFLSIDPLMEKYPAHTPYQYAFNSPIQFKDPSGLAPEKDKVDKIQTISDYWLEYCYQLRYEQTNSIMCFDMPVTNAAGDEDPRYYESTSCKTASDIYDEYHIARLEFDDIARIWHENHPDEDRTGEDETENGTNNEEGDNPDGPIDPPKDDNDNNSGFTPIDLTEKFDLTIGYIRGMLSGIGLMINSVFGKDSPIGFGVKCETIRTLFDTGEPFDLKTHGYTKKDIGGEYALYKGDKFAPWDFGNFGFGVGIRAIG